MGAQFGTTKIGAMQYNGVTIGEAMMDGQIVYRSVIRVTPAAPTFLTASPWYTLPTQAGVTYTVSGTPGYNQSVTITATPQAGYELAGQTSWAHTYGPQPSPYPASGTWGPVSIQTFQFVDILTHTMSESGNFTFTVTDNSSELGFYYYRNGAFAVNAHTWTANLVQGDTIVVEAVSVGGSGTYSGTWSIVKN